MSLIEKAFGVSRKQYASDDMVSEDLVVKLASLVIKMEHLVVILSGLVVKNKGLVVIVKFWDKKRRVSQTERAFGGAISSNKALSIPYKVEKRAA